KCLDTAQFHSNGDEYTDDNELPVEIEGKDTFCECGHECCLWRRESFGTNCVFYTLSLHFQCRRIENLHHVADSNRRNDRANKKRELLITRRCSHQETALQIL